MVRNRLRLGLLGVLACAQMACGADANPPEQTLELEVFDTRLIGEPAPEEPDRDTEVLLLDPGEEPRRVLRYRIVPQTEQKVVINSSGSMRQEVDGNPLSKQRWPTTRLEVILRAQSGGDATSRRLQLEFLEAQRVDYPRMIFARGEQLVITDDSLLAEPLEMSISARGILDQDLFEDMFVVDPSLETPERADIIGTLTGMIETALPEEEVGVGARWRVKSPTASLPFAEAEVIQIFELVAMDGDHLELAEVVTADLSEGAFPDVEDLQVASSVSGRRVVDLGRVAPSKYEHTGTTTISLAVREGQDTHRVHITIVMEIDGVSS